MLTSASFVIWHIINLLAIAVGIGIVALIVVFLITAIRVLRKYERAHFGGNPHR